MGRPKKNIHAIPTGKNQQLRKHILDKSAELFYKQGYSKVTVDEISKHADISKKTLYDYFLTKYEILNEIISNLIDDTNKKLSQIVDDKKLSFTEKLTSSFTISAFSMSQITIQFMQDLRYKLPELYFRISEFKKQAVIKYFSKLLKEGKQEGYIKKDLNTEVTIALFVSSIEQLSDANFLNTLPDKIRNKYPKTSKEVFNGIIDVLYFGILTEENRNKIKFN